MRHITSFFSGKLSSFSSRIDTILSEYSTVLDDGIVNVIFTLSALTGLLLSLFIDSTTIHNEMSTTKHPVMQTAGLRRLVFSNTVYICMGRWFIDILSWKTLCPLFFFSITYVAIGMNSNATVSENRSVAMIEIPMCSPIRRMNTSSENRNGRNTVMVVSVDAMIDFHTSRVPCVTACSALLPCVNRRYMFSSTTILLSSNIPMANAIPMSVRLFIEMS